MREETDSPAEARPAIMLIEEDDNARPPLKNTLRQLGYRVLVADDVEDALEWVGDGSLPADLVLINLVGKSPEEALDIGRKLCARAKYDGHTPLVVMPEKVPEEMAGRDVNVGGNNWITYFEDGEQLHRLIKRLLNKDSAQTT